MIIDLIHKAEIDDCIVAEIVELNNIHNIHTVYSCCGHKNNEKAFILVFEQSDFDKMMKLGYKQKKTGTYYISFQPKSECKCIKPISPSHAKEMLIVKQKGIPPNHVGLNITVDMNELKKYYNENLSKYLSSQQVVIINGKKIKYFTFEEFLIKLDVIE
jgi:hypothetical protein